MPARQKRRREPSKEKLAPRVGLEGKRRASGAANKFAISFNPALASDVRRAAKRGTRGNVSAWLAEAARQQLRHEALEEAITTYEAKHGVITDEELAEVDRLW